MHDDSRGDRRRWPLLAVIGAVVLVVGIVATAAIWIAGSLGSDADVDVDVDEASAGQSRDDAPADSPGDGDGGTSGPAVEQPSRDTVIENLMSAEVPPNCSDMTGPLVDGVYNPPGDMYATVSLKWIDNDTGEESTPESETAFGDVTGDGIDDVAVRLFCWPGGVGWPDLIAIYEVSADGSVAPIGGVFPWDFEGVTMGESRGTFTNPPTYADGAFVLEGGIDTDGAPNAASSVADTLYTATFTAPGGVLTQTGLSSAPL